MIRITNKSFGKYFMFLLFSAFFGSFLHFSKYRCGNQREKEKKRSIREKITSSTISCPTKEQFYWEKKLTNYNINYLFNRPLRKRCRWITKLDEKERKKSFSAKKEPPKKKKKTTLKKQLLFTFLFCILLLLL